jgi:hypothetical protein
VALVPLGFGCVLIQRQLASFFELSVLVVREGLALDASVLPLAMDAHNGSDVEYVLSCVRSDRISSWSSAF